MSPSARYAVKEGSLRRSSQGSDPSSSANSVLARKSALRTESERSTSRVAARACSSCIPDCTRTTALRSAGGRMMGMLGRVTAQSVPKGGCCWGRPGKRLRPCEAPHRCTWGPRPGSRALPVAARGLEQPHRPHRAARARPLLPPPFPSLPPEPGVRQELEGGHQPPHPPPAPTQPGQAALTGTGWVVLQEGVHGDHGADAGVGRPRRGLDGHVGPDAVGQQGQGGLALLAEVLAQQVTLVLDLVAQGEDLPGVRSPRMAGGKMPHGVYHCMPLSPATTLFERLDHVREKKIGLEACLTLDSPQPTQLQTTPHPRG
uniref:Uncharacterized protein n=1 Tax=Auxenochlorella protothecoides TaxID=3075 RepID=A0A1D2AC92_AUXPR